MEHLLAEQAAASGALENGGTTSANDDDLRACTNGEFTMTKVYVHLEVLADCPFSVAQDYVTDYLRREGTDFSVGVRKDTNERGRSHDELSVQWAARAPLLPLLLINGTLRFRIAGNLTRLVLDASYDPPGGALGRIVDAVLGHRLAVKMCRDLVRRIAGELTERERAWRPRRGPLHRASPNC